MKKKMSENLLSIILETKGKCEEEAGYTGGNIVTLLMKISPSLLENKDLSNSVILGTDFTSGSLQRVNLSGAYLTHSILPGTLGAIYSVALSANNEFLATGEANGDIHVWKIFEKIKIKKFFVLKGHTDSTQSLEFSSDSVLLASGSHDQTIKIWDVKSGVCLKKSNRTYRFFTIPFV